MKAFDNSVSFSDKRRWLARRGAEIFVFAVGAGLCWLLAIGVDRLMSVLEMH